MHFLDYIILLAFCEYNIQLHCNYDLDANNDPHIREVTKGQFDTWFEGEPFASI